ncbi:uncharacterized protein L201_001853 [Kwoniella dendrophila CBS 6074]|uniref:Fe2OG dioxygenase domain-containing protein n=1 Tax=Kwoniella dendrophila CBS 6074 TaxID=1295534 RepID=A0AAX4JNM8_9TREE
MNCTRSHSPDSLFSESDDETAQNYKGLKIAKRIAPDIPGLWVFPSLLSDDVARMTLDAIASSNVFSCGQRDQVMLFESPKLDSREESSLPIYINNLIDQLKDLLDDEVSKETIDLLFNQNLSRQVILNLYQPGKGIKLHIDLPNRYSDGILGCSLIGGCVMILNNNNKNEVEHEHKIYMPPRTVYILSGESRWEWEHGIEENIYEDLVENESEIGIGTGIGGIGAGSETILRDLRVSITFRWMKQGADVLS